jgi:hypothetical protein
MQVTKNSFSWSAEMAYAPNYKRPRPDDYGQGFPDAHHQQLMQPPIEYGPPPVPHLLHPAMPPESLRLGSAPDGTMPVVKLRGLPFSCGPDEINLFLVRLLSTIHLSTMIV